MLSRGTIATSAVLHIALLSGLFFVRTERSVTLPGPDVVQVALIGEPAPPPEPAPVVKPTDTVTPDEEEGVRIQKERPKPKPVVKQQPKPATPQPPPPKPPTSAETPPVTTPAPSDGKHPQLSFTPVGDGMAGGIAADDANFEFAYYLQMVRTQIARNWTPPDGSGTGTKVVLHFRVARSGAISALQLETGSGNGVFDQSALRAVVITQQLPPLPLGYAGADLGIHLGFEFTGQ